MPAKYLGPPAVSKALEAWQRDQSRRLDELQAAHHAVGGSGPGRRHATQQINDAYIVLLSAQFQQFCRDLHSEAASRLALAVTPVSLRVVLSALLTQNRQLDRGNAQPGNLGTDFGRFGMDFWKSVNKADTRNAARQRKLEQLNIWRNAIAHQNFALKGDDLKKVRLTERKLRYIKLWRSACNGLAINFDRAVRDHLTSLTGAAPW
jgi:hypothetical protein